MKGKNRMTGKIYIAGLKKREKENSEAYWNAKLYANAQRCPECGRKGQFELFGEDYDHYICKMCNYEGDFSDDIATMHAVEDDMLHSYTCLLYTSFTRSLQKSSKTGWERYI